MAGGDAELVWLPMAPPHCCPLVRSALLGLSVLELRTESCSRSPWARAPGWSSPAASHPPCDMELVIYRCLHIGSYAKFNGILIRGLPPANVQALLPRARMSSQLVSPEPPLSCQCSAICIAPGVSCLSQLELPVALGQL